MNIPNYIEAQYRELADDINMEYEDLYELFSPDKLRQIFSTLHHILISSYKSMNSRLPTKENTEHFWAESSRRLIRAIQIITDLQRALNSSSYAFEIDKYYADLIRKSTDFLSESGGSTIPSHMDKVELYYTLPIFLPQNTVCIETEIGKKFSELKLIGEGSYAQVFKYKDPFYKKTFVLKRAKSDLNPKEQMRFKREFDKMNEFHSPYIVEVYCFNDTKKEYIMEFMDCSLDKYIEKNNSVLSMGQRKNIVNQILRAFKYIHSKEMLHRDISPKNILLKLYDDVIVVKIADFGLVKIPDSNLTSVNTEFKGYFNDPELIVSGFDSYAFVHETYALTRLIYYIVTGKTNISDVKNANLKAFVEKGLSINKENRFKSVDEILNAFKII